METLVLVLVVITAIVVVVLISQAVKAGQSSDLAGDQAVAGEKRRLGLQPNDTLPYASSTLPSYVVVPEDVTIVEAPSQEDAVIVSVEPAPASVNTK